LWVSQSVMNIYKPMRWESSIVNIIYKFIHICQTSLWKQDWWEIMWSLWLFEGINVWEFLIFCMYNTITIVMHSFAKETQMSILHKLLKIIEEDENLLLLWHLFTNFFKGIIICLLLLWPSLPFCMSHITTFLFGSE
jgi:hypothetical protein